MDRIDAAATAEHAASLQLARQVNAAVGLIGAPIAFIGLSGWAILSWRRFGKDPVYLDDPSILMPAPPPDLTAASGAMVMDGATSRRALTTAMLDLASRGLVAFREEKGILSRKVGVDTDPDPGDAVLEAQRARNSRRPTGPAETVALRELRQLGAGEEDSVITADDLPKFGTHVAEFDTALERHVVDRGWFAEKPSKVVTRWVGRGIPGVGRRDPGHRRWGDAPGIGPGLDRDRDRRRLHRHARAGSEHAGGLDGRRDDPGDARRVPAHAQEDHGAGTLDAAGGG